VSVFEWIFAVFVDEIMRGCLEDLKDKFENKKGGKVREKGKGKGEGGREISNLYCFQKY
jgi:hypothetical protein